MAYFINLLLFIHTVFIEWMGMLMGLLSSHKLCSNTKEKKMMNAIIDLSFVVCTKWRNKKKTYSKKRLWGWSKSETWSRIWNTTYIPRDNFIEIDNENYFSECRLLILDFIVMRNHLLEYVVHNKQCWFSCCLECDGIKIKEYDV